ncbi:MAG: succinate dehydrogenase, hydrophobic membrane anchor protein [Gammaproteobacteria bacterium]|nr:succinate dehydrogenase, hydrophobic membrane anchor protein [Gammaproteobacteria bacterium]
MSLRSPLSKVKGLGSAKEGTGHWWMQRVTALALVVLGFWFIISLVAIGDFGYQHTVAWLARPLNAVLLSSFVMTLLYHSKLGVQIVIEDYVSASAWKVGSLLFSVFVHLLLAVTGVFSILRISVGGLS